MEYFLVSDYGKFKSTSRGEACVYMLLNEEKEIIYIGQTKQLKLRVSSHVQSKKDAFYFTFERVDAGKLNNKEASLISTHKPKYNKTLPRNDFYIKKSLFKRDIELEVGSFITDISTDLELQGKGSDGYNYVKMYKSLIAMEMIRDCIKEIKIAIK